MNYQSFNNCNIFLSKCPPSYTNISFKNNIEEGICCTKYTKGDYIDLTNIIREKKDTNFYYNYLLTLLNDDNLLRKYIYSVILYSRNGDELVNNYIRNNNHINDTIISLYDKYTNNLLRYLNKFGKKCDNDDIDVDIDKKKIFIKCYIQNLFDDLNNLFKLVEPLIFNLAVYRAIKLPKGTFNYKENNLIHFNGFISTSLSVCNAQKFIFNDIESCNDDETESDIDDDYKYIFLEEEEIYDEENYGGIDNDNVIFKIILPIGSKCIPILKDSEFNEYEILLKNESIFYISKIYRRPLQYNVELIYIDNFEITEENTNNEREKEKISNENKLRNR